eukprot:768755-Hanusia_phi.AAC.3
MNASAAVIDQSSRGGRGQERTRRSWRDEQEQEQEQVRDRGEWGGMSRSRSRSRLGIEENGERGMEKGRMETEPRR